jgi:hypothetical protein
MASTTSKRSPLASTGLHGLAAEIDREAGALAWSRATWMLVGAGSRPVTLAPHAGLRLDSTPPPQPTVEDDQALQRARRARIAPRSARRRVADIGRGARD